MARPRGLPISDFARRQVKLLLADGLKAPTISKRLGISMTTVRRIRDHVGVTPPPPPKPRFDFAPAETETLVDPAELYRREKARRAERMAQRPEMHAAKAEMARQLELQRQAGKGGRPKGSPTIRAPKPGKPMILAVRSDPADALLNALGEFHGAA